ncbi:hypothetical protein BV25DRAFT_1810916 [Artomyces pyxidatus]|uniref:Uncharacterized protein n=1 Tax=Artomyces pyxidatus TaxID=48021 RepID=A0ACB8SPE1_9AGAM|nr:hypothetical protein BV25DRAFT_1810916 [Artomyces pyxidatus]
MNNTIECTPIHGDLHKQFLDMRRVHESILSYEPAVSKPPILDSSIDLSEPHDFQERVTGLRPLLETVKRDMDVMEKFLVDPQSASLPPLSTNAPYLIAVWKEVLLAPTPVLAVGKSFTNPDDALAKKPRVRGQATKPTGVKVDIIADNGRTWIRVNTIKNSRLLSEFREIDSYLTDSSDDSDSGLGPSLAQKEFDNSLLRAGRALLAAANSHPIPGSATRPTVILCLTRLDPDAPDERERDPRIALTIQLLQSMGLVVELSERDDALLDARPAPISAATRQLRPTTHINLDLSILIALVSDLTHAPLPTSTAAAAERFVPSAAYLEWKKSRLRSQDRDEDDAEDTGKHSRALAEQLQQEMRRGMLQELRDRLPASPSAVEFWTTQEARDRFLRIVAKVGGPREKQRALALFPSRPAHAPEDADRYWAHSRYPPRFLPLLPIHIFGPDAPPATPARPFFGALAQTCRALLAQEVAPHPRTAAFADAAEIQRATVMRANAKLTEHTVQSMLCGARRGWTTLTANRASVKAMLKEMRARGAAVEDGGDGRSNAAVIWMVDPRSLAEGMRSDFVG